MHRSEYHERQRNQTIEWVCISCTQEVLEDSSSMDIDEPEPVESVLEGQPLVTQEENFNVNIPFVAQENILEDSLQMDLEPIPEAEPQYEIIRGGNIMGGDLLLCPQDFTYNKHSKGRGYYWRCCKKGSTKCLATVKEEMGKHLLVY